ncbi:MAG: hypothetical protein ABF746_04865 [Acetobacter orientalis]|uniref:hypothetical protein n=1 Tax=Acetobacter orientalis TaxID=146474 RepID=UPI0039EB1D12
MENVASFLHSALPARLFTLHDYAMGVAVWQAAKQAGVPLHLNGRAAYGFISAPGAAGYMGVATWQALVQAIAKQTGFSCPHILDCGPSAGYAAMAAGHGQSLIVLQNDSAATKAVTALYAQRGGHVFITRPPSFDLIRAVSVPTHLAAYFSRSYCE